MSRYTKRHGKHAVQIGGVTKRDDSAFEKLAYLEDLEEQGRLIELPCKVGDKVWMIVSEDDDSYTMEWDIVQGIHIERYAEYALDLRLGDRIDVTRLNGIPLSAFGNVIFTTKEEAEAKLEELKGKE